jgi:hypothetical protein
MKDQNKITKIDNTYNKSKAKKTNRREAVGNQSIARSMMWGT